MHAVVAPIVSHQRSQPKPLPDTGAGSPAGDARSLPSWNGSLVPRLRLAIMPTKENASLTCKYTEPVSGFEPLTCRLQGQSR
jgi:hypothetical protein